MPIDPLFLPNLETWETNLGEESFVTISVLYALLESWRQEDTIMLFVSKEGPPSISGIPGWSVIYANNRVINYFGYTTEEWFNNSIPVTFVNEDDIEVVVESIMSRSSLPYNVRLRKKAEVGLGAWFEVRNVYADILQTKYRIGILRKK